MAFSQANVITTGVTVYASGKDATEACFNKASGLFAGIQPWGLLSGTQDVQGTIGPIKWRAADWVITAHGGAGTTLVPQDGHPNVGKFITRATADGDGYNLQWSKDGGTTVQEIFKPTAGEVIVCYGRFKLDNASTDAHTKGRFNFGLSDTNTDIEASDDDLITFVKASGAATMVGRLAKGGTATDTSALTNSLADNTYIQLGIRVNGVTSVEFWQGAGSTIGALSRVATQTTVTNLADEELALSFEGETSEAAAITFYLQHLVAFQEAL